MVFRTIAGLVIALFEVACSPLEINTVGAGQKEQEFLYIYPDGRMEFNGRTMNDEDVVIYEDGRGGERAAVKLRIPNYPDVYRDTIIVERKDVPVERKK